MMSRTEKLAKRVLLYILHGDVQRVQLALSQPWLDRRKFFKKLAEVGRRPEVAVCLPGEEALRLLKEPPDREEKLARRLMLYANNGDTTGVRFSFARDNPARAATIKELARMARTMEDVLPPDSVLPFFQEPTNAEEAQRELLQMSVQRFLDEEAQRGKT